MNRVELHINGEKVIDWEFDNPVDNQGRSTRARHDWREKRINKVITAMSEDHINLLLRHPYEFEFIIFLESKFNNWKGRPTKNP